MLWTKWVVRDLLITYVIFLLDLILRARVSKLFVSSRIKDQSRNLRNAIKKYTLNPLQFPLTFLQGERKNGGRTLPSSLSGSVWPRASRGPISRRAPHREIYDRVKKCNVHLEKQHGDREAADRRLAGKSWSRESTPGETGSRYHEISPRRVVRCLLWLSWIQEISSREMFIRRGPCWTITHLCVQHGAS